MLIDNTLWRGQVALARGEPLARAVRCSRVGQQDRAGLKRSRVHYRPPGLPRVCISARRLLTGEHWDDTGGIHATDLTFVEPAHAGPKNLITLCCAD